VQNLGTDHGFNSISSIFLGRLFLLEPVGLLFFARRFLAQASGSVSNNLRPVRLAYQPPANSTFLSEQTSHQQPASSTFLSEQTSTSHQPNEQVVDCRVGLNAEQPLPDPFYLVLA
jgi:hypothetical protein